MSKGRPDAWLYFYEDFLEVYDPKLRKLTGSYYTPPEVVDAMVRLVDEALRSPLFGRPDGLAARDVVIADPAVGTGTFLLGVLRKIASHAEEDKGAGAVPGVIAAAAERIVGFELQFGPFAVAQLRLVAEMRALMQAADRPGTNIPDLRLFVTDTLGNPFVEEERLPQILEPIARSRREANAVKRGEPITVVIGNPPYKEKARGRGGWVEAGGDKAGGVTAPMARWMPPPAWGVSASAHHLKNLYVYFWRWAALKVFGAGWYAATGQPDEDRAGIVCFITVAGFLNGPGFQAMRADLRRSCADIWVIDCSPEGHQPEVATRIFQGVQHPVCIVLAAKPLRKDPAIPARIHFRRLAAGRREDKFCELAGVGLDDSGWVQGASDWRDPLGQRRAVLWESFVALGDVFTWSTPGVTTHRTWVIAPDVATLQRRWSTLQSERNVAKRSTLFHPDRDRQIDRIVSVDLGRFATRPTSVMNDVGPIVPPVRYAFRAFDRQWLPPDHRLLSQARSQLWAANSPIQVHLTALSAQSPKSGPALTLCAAIPDLDHYKGSFGGRVFPLWRDAAATVPNVKPALTAHLAAVLGLPVSPEDVLAYVAALLAHPAFTARFASDLVQPGLRVPLTGDAALFAEAVALGREIVWLHTYGERFADPAAGRPARAPRLPKGEGPTIPAGGAIPGAPEPLPEEIRYDPAARRLHVGAGYVDNVPPEVWAYEVSGKQVVRQWFSYRKRDRTRPVIGDRRPPSELDRIQPESWPASYTEDLMDLLHVLGRLVRLEARQADLLERICAAPLLDAASLVEAGALVAPDEPEGRGGARRGADERQQVLL